MFLRLISRQTLQTLHQIKGALNGHSVKLREKQKLSVIEHVGYNKGYSTVLFLLVLLL